MKSKELEQIIEKHSHWLYKDVDGWETMRANLRCADLSNVDMRDIDLRGADLRYAKLIYADLGNVNLSSADLIGATMWGVDLSDADLRSADLSYACMRYANLRDVDLSDANLKGADMCGVDLEGANLSDTNLWDADLDGSKNAPYIPMICPEEGAFIGYKKACDKIVKLLIPEDAKRSSATTRKCRCNKAVVLGIYELDGSISTVTEVASNKDKNFIYKINKEVVVDDFNNDRWVECSTGIHFFMQRQEAIDYII